MTKLTPEFKRSLDVLVRQELSQLPTREERGHYLHEIELYLLSLCPKHPNNSDKYKCETCEEDCKYG